MLTPDVTQRLRELQEAGDIGQSSPDGKQNNAIRDRKRLWVIKFIPYELRENLKGIFLLVSF